MENNQEQTEGYMGTLRMKSALEDSKLFYLDEETQKLLFLTDNDKIETNLPFNYLFLENSMMVGNKEITGIWIAKAEGGIMVEVGIYNEKGYGFRMFDLLSKTNWPYLNNYKL